MRSNVYCARTLRTQPLWTADADGTGGAVLGRCSAIGDLEPTGSVASAAATTEQHRIGGTRYTMASQPSPSRPLVCRPRRRNGRRPNPFFWPPGTRVTMHRRSRCRSGGGGSVRFIFFFSTILRPSLAASPTYRPTGQMYTTRKRWIKLTVEVLNKKYFYYLFYSVTF